MIPKTMKPANKAKIELIDEILDDLLITQYGVVNPVKSKYQLHVRDELLRKKANLAIDNDQAFLRYDRVFRGPWAYSLEQFK
jgi:hypothetical protein